MKSITVFTPTYNRKHLLPRLYESLKNQTVKDFVWLVIDDGSTDGTENLVRSWQQENIIEIQYHYKENGGMHTAHNTAYALIITELNVCIDSDDCMPEIAVKVILENWDKTGNKEAVSGLVALDADLTGKIIGCNLPENVTQGSYYDLYEKYKCRGDKKFILKTVELKKYQFYPEFENERLVPLGILYIMMGETKPFVFINEIVCLVEYQAQGSSNTIIKQYFESPQGFAYARKMRLKYTRSLKDIFKNSLHLAAIFYMTKHAKVFSKDNKYRLLTFVLLPAGFIFYYYLRLRR